MTLVVVVMPDGTLNLEFTEDTGQISKKQTLLNKQIFNNYSNGTLTWLFFLGLYGKDASFSPSLKYWSEFSNFFIEKLRLTPDLETIRTSVKIPPDKKFLENLLLQAPLFAGSEYLSPTLLENLWNNLNDIFLKEVNAFNGTVEAFFHKHSSHINLAGRIFFHLVENHNNDFPFAFLATYSTHKGEDGNLKHIPLKYALQEYSNNEKQLLELLKMVYLAAEQSTFIADLLESGEIFNGQSWTLKQAYTFLKDVQLIEEKGIICRIPDWWKHKKSSISLKINVGTKSPSVVDMGAIVDFNAKLFFGDNPISEREAKKLLLQSEGLAFIKNQWTVVDSEKLQQTLKAYEKIEQMMEEGDFSIREALRLQLNPKKFTDTYSNEIDISITNGKWLSSVIKKLKDPTLIRSVKPDKSFNAKLRKYQQKGVNWLFFLNTLKFGACLADDMGLGKTIQVLAFLNILKKKNARAVSLLVVPASLISNWQNEIKNFYPDLKTLIAHPEKGYSTGKKAKKPDLNKFDLVITTYALVSRYSWLESKNWTVMILDEAQAIKNPGTKQTRTVKRFKAQTRIIMTGTPIENRLSDLWSLFDFINPGLLGNAKEFTAFSKSLKDDSSGYQKIRTLIFPFILRRMKTDKSVISDLPDKVEMKAYTTLSRKQTVLYKDLVDQIKNMLESTEGIQRKGIILSSLMKFKQLCNHPDQYLGTGGFHESESGKFERLKEICETIYEKRERVLIFTQFKEIISPLNAFLNRVFNKEGLVMHGSIPVKKRKKIIEEFQSDKYIPFMILSLKAGGVGLNLTNANHVVHFDRWWNPAVENQATDRAFRIGQKKGVMVHKFITRGTIEEKINEMLEEKSKMSGEIISSSAEGWITELEDDKLMEFFSL